MQKHPSRRTLVVIVLSLTGIFASAAGAFAWHGACPTNAPNLDPRPGKKTYVSTATTSNSYSVCFSANDPDPGGGCGAGTPTDPGICGGVTLTLGDPNPASIGRTVAISGGASQVGPIAVGQTGAEAGSISGTMVSGTTVYVHSTPISTGAFGLDPARSASVSTGPNVPVCAGVCVSVPGPPYKVDTGYDVVVQQTNSRIKLCVAVGATC